MSDIHEPLRLNFPELNSLQIERLRQMIGEETSDAYKQGYLQCLEDNGIQPSNKEPLD